MNNLIHTQKTLFELTKWLNSRSTYTNVWPHAIPHRGRYHWSITKHSHSSSCTCLHPKPCDFFFLILNPAFWVITINLWGSLEGKTNVNHFKVSWLPRHMGLVKPKWFFMSFKGINSFSCSTEIVVFFPSNVLWIKCWPSVLVF